MSVLFWCERPRTDLKHDGSCPSFSGVNPGQVRPGPRTEQLEAQTVCAAECSILWKCTNTAFCMESGNLTEESVPSHPLTRCGHAFPISRRTFVAGEGGSSVMDRLVLNFSLCVCEVILWGLWFMHPACSLPNL